jgi:D-serine deaminase-like pyridoxal phosphate-dependent protein
VRKLTDFRTPFLAIELDTFYKNLERMQAIKPGLMLRPHVKAFKSTSIASILEQAGYSKFCCATIREIEGMITAGFGDDLLLANESLDVSGLSSVVEQGADLTVAVDSIETIDAACEAGIRRVLIDVNVGLPRCGCDITEVEHLCSHAKRKGLDIRGVMGYEGHLMFTKDRSQREKGVRKAMHVLGTAHSITGGDIISAGGTGTFDLNELATEIQAGSFLFMDSRYGTLDLPFEESLSIVSTIISKDLNKGRAVCDAGVKSFSMDYGKPSFKGGVVEFCSDEHATIRPVEPESELELKVGDLIKLRVPHVDPTIAKHPKLLGVKDGYVLEEWKVDLRDW